LWEGGSSNISFFAEKVTDGRNDDLKKMPFTHEEGEILFLGGRYEEDKSQKRT